MTYQHLSALNCLEARNTVSSDSSFLTTKYDLEYLLIIFFRINRNKYMYVIIIYFTGYLLSQDIFSLRTTVIFWHLSETDVV